ncbi:MAG: bifunctional pyr operon transcriptional regulator/uracil phosphoribosyltransferase PyrR [bacterium]
MKVLMDSNEIEKRLEAMADELAGMLGNGRAAQPGFVGIRSRGIPLAQRLCEKVERKTRAKIPLGTLDITLYRDDLSTLAQQPIVGPTNLPFDVEGRPLVLVDDVIYTGRTARAALQAIVDFGRPQRVLLAVLVDRGWREYPIHPDVTGMTVATTPSQMVKVQLPETDGREEVTLVERSKAS